MTANQLKAQENELKREELAERRKTGKAERFEKYAKGFKHAASVGRDTTGGAKDIATLIGAVNDPSWYNKDKQLVNDVAQFPYGQPIGINVERTNFTTSGSTPRSLNKIAQPGVLRLEFTPTVGDGSGNESDAINVAMRNVYAFVRHANSGSRNYDAPDLMQYFMTMSSIYSLIAHCERGYSIALTAKSQNRYYPNSMLSAAGFWPSNRLTSGSSIADQLAQFRAEINMAIQKASIFNVPAQFPYFNRHIWMCSNVFKDGAYHRSREYVFVPSAYYECPDINGKQMGIRYFSTDANGLIDGVYGRQDPTGSTTYQSVTNMSYRGAVALLKYLIDKATQNEDYGIMSGDILKAFGDTGVFKLVQMSEDFHIESIHSPEVLTQIQAATILPGAYDGCFVGQNLRGILYQGGQIINASHALEDAAGIFVHHTGNVLTVPGCDKVLINMYKDEVTPDDNMVATRLSNVYQWKQTDYFTAASSSGSTNVYECICQAETGASEVIDGACLFCNAGDADLSTTFRSGSLNALVSPGGLHFDGIGISVSQGIGSEQGALEVYTMTQVINAFEWAPRILLNAYEGSGQNIYPIYCNSDLANYIYVAKPAIQQLHAVALLSLFAVPMLGNTVRKY